MSNELSEKTQKVEQYLEEYLSIVFSSKNNKLKAKKLQTIQKIKSDLKQLIYENKSISDLLYDDVLEIYFSKSLTLIDPELDDEIRTKIKDELIIDLLHYQIKHSDGEKNTSKKSSKILKDEYREPLSEEEKYLISSILDTLDKESINKRMENLLK